MGGAYSSGEGRSGKGPTYKGREGKGGSLLLRGDGREGRAQKEERGDGKATGGNSRQSQGEYNKTLGKGYTDDACTVHPIVLSHLLFVPKCLIGDKNKKKLCG